MLMSEGAMESLKRLNAAERKWETVTLPSGQLFTKLELAYGVVKGYDHLPEGGYRVSGGRKVYAEEWDARDATVRALRKRVKGWLEELDLLLG